MEVILKEDVVKLGHRGDVVKVADGYGRNYLLPGKLAIEATLANRAVIEQIKQRRGYLLNIASLAAVAHPPRALAHAVEGSREIDGDVALVILVRDLGATRCGASATATILDEYQKRAASQNKQSADRPQKPVLGSGGY